MTVGFLWHCVYPWDVRLEKMADALAASGHRVSVICKGRSSLPAREHWRSATIRRVWVGSQRIPRALVRCANYPFFFNPTWKRQVRAAIAEENIDVLIVRDIPLAILAAREAHRSGKRVILDMAENYPAALVSYQKPIYKPFLIFDAWLPRRYERACLHAVDHVLVVADEQRQRLLSQGAHPSFVTLVGNTPVESFVRAVEHPTESPTTGCDGGPKLLYVGFLDPHRGVDVVVRALPELRQSFPHVTLTLVGDGRSRQHLMSLAAKLGIASAVRCPGWVSFEDLPGYIRDSDVCLIPHLASEHTNTTLPNKLFDYMAFAKPVIAADCRPIQRIIEETGCGEVFRSGDTTDFIRAVERVARDAGKNNMGKKGRRAVCSTYNWETDKRVFVNLVENIREAPIRV